MKDLNDFITEKLLQIKAIKLQPHNPFDWGNGWVSPIYCDNRKVLSYPQTRSVITLELARVVAEKYPNCEVIAGVATNAIAIGVLVADALGLPFIYVHPTPKDHGFENMIEGDLRPHQKVVIIEEQVSVGENSGKVADAIRKNGCEVLGLISLFDYELQESKKQFEKLGLEHTTLSNLKSVLELAIATNYISLTDAQIIEKWSKNPAKWKKEDESVRK